MVVAIASIRKPKVAAVQAVFRRLARQLNLAAEKLVFDDFDIGSGVEETPKSLERIMQGARSRALNLRNLCIEKSKDAAFVIGLEGGLFSVDGSSFGRQTFLQSWACVLSDGRESFGASGAILVPQSIAGPVINENQSLSDVIDRTAMQQDIRSKQGTWGILSRDLITRQASFEVALTSALAPFYNPVFYRSH
jgi:non-canonical (house-cleaning) NTP pyrophosphatase